jgi:hypothetical protein
MAGSGDLGRGRAIVEHRQDGDFAPSIVPIFGTRRLDRVKENLGAAEVSLSDEDMAAIEARLAAIEVIGERLPPDLLKVTYR